MENSERLSKRMAHLGMCSRREADAYIEKGWVLVNGVAAVLGQKVGVHDRIELLPAARRSIGGKVTVLLNKPVGYVSAQAEKGYRAAAELISAEHYWAGKEEAAMPPLPLKGLAPAGRLDIDSTGLLVLTQDGRVAKYIIGEDSTVDKEYLVRVAGTLSPQGLQLLNHGLELDGEKLLPAEVTWQNRDQLRFVLRQGKKRQIRRMCELVGLRVVGLKRVRIGRVRLGDLPPGKWRVLRPDERF